MHQLASLAEQMLKKSFQGYYTKKSSRTTPPQMHARVPFSAEEELLSLHTFHRAELHVNLYEDFTFLNSILTLRTVLSVPESVMVSGEIRLPDQSPYHSLFSTLHLKHTSPYSRLPHSKSSSSFSIEL